MSVSSDDIMAAIDAPCVAKIKGTVGRDRANTQGEG
jgi:hypothetical protein